MGSNSSSAVGSRKECADGMGSVLMLGASLSDSGSDAISDRGGGSRSC